MILQLTASSTVAVIGDLVGSRRQASRAGTQDALEFALTSANEHVPSVQPLEPTIGDEFQGVYADVPTALLAVLVARLALPASLDARCGVGIGPIEVVGASRYGLTQDGPAWWAAREAIVDVKERERQLPGLRSQVRRHEPGAADAVNAYLLCRDQIVSGLDARQRRLALGVLLGRTQKELAAQEGISPSAVSQSVRRSGITTVVQSTRELGR